MQQLVTHDGQGHADDLFAYVVLSTIWPGHELIRTRDKEMISTPSHKKVIFDVGMVYDKDNNQFDHHQKNKELRPDGIPYSSFGLVWKHWGFEYLLELGLEEENIPAIREKIDQSFVRLIDIGDNGVDCEETKFVTHKLSISRILSLLLFSGTDEDFIDASIFARKILKNMVAAELSVLKASFIVDSALEKYDGSGILVLPSDCSIASVAKKNATVKFVVYPRSDGKTWGISNIRDHSNSFEARGYLPANTGGLEGGALVSASGIPDLTFCHAGLFFALGNTFESVFALGTMSLK